MRCLPDEDSLEQKKSASTTSEQPSKLLSFPRMAVFTGAAGMGLAALWAILLYFSSALVPEIPVESNHSEPPLLVQSTDIESPSSISDDPDSPLHGLSLDQIQDISVMPVSGWLDPRLMSVYCGWWTKVSFNNRADYLHAGFAIILWMRPFGVILHLIPVSFPPLLGRKLF